MLILMAISPKLIGVTEYYHAALSEYDDIFAMGGIWLSASRKPLNNNILDNPAGITILDNALTRI